MIIQSLYDDDNKDKTPSQIAANQNKSANSGAIQPIYGANDNYKYVAPKPVAQPQAQQPQQNNYFQAAIKAITDTATKAINVIQGKNFVSPIPQQNIVPDNNPKPISPTIKPIQSNPSKIVYTNNSAQPTLFNRVGNIIDTALNATAETFPESLKIVHNIVNNPASIPNQKTPKQTNLNNLSIALTHNDPINAAKLLWQAVKPTMLASGDDLKNAFTSDTSNQPTSAKIGNTIHAGVGVVNFIASPVTAFFNSVNQIPVAGTLSQVFTLAFTELGEGGSAVSNYAIDQLTKNKILTPEQSNNLKPAFAEIGSLVGQLVGGESLNIKPVKNAELIKKYGSQDATTIISTAQKIADNQKQTALNKPSNTVELTPAQARAQVQATDLQGTPAGDAMLKAAKEAEKQGKSLQISTRPQEVPSANLHEQKLLSATNPPSGVTQGEGFTVSDKVNKENLVQAKNLNSYRKAVDSFSKNPTPTKLKTVQKAREVLQTPQGNKFTIDFVEPTVIKPIKTSDKTIGQLQQETQSPDLTNYEDAFNKGDTATMDSLAAKNPGDKRFQIHKELPASNTPALDALTSKNIKETAEPIKAAPANTEGKTPSSIASSIERKAVEQKLTKGFEGVAGYDKITIKDQSEKATKVFENVDQARKIIRGEEPLPSGLRGTALITAAEEHIAKTGDAEMAHDLANSPLVSETSAAAQEMRLAAEREPDSLAARLQELKKTKLDAIEKRTGKTVKKAVDNTVQKIKKTVPKAKKEDWSSFIQSIQC